MVYSKRNLMKQKVGNVEDFISLTRVYFQSVIATNLGITNIRFYRMWLTQTFVQDSYAGR